MLMYNVLYMYVLLFSEEVFQSLVPCIFNDVVLTQVFFHEHTYSFCKDIPCS